MLELNDGALTTLESCFVAVVLFLTKDQQQVICCKNDLCHQGAARAFLNGLQYTRAFKSRGRLFWSCMTEVRCSLVISMFMHTNSIDHLLPSLILVVNQESLVTVLDSRCFMCKAKKHTKKLF